MVVCSKCSTPKNPLKVAKKNIIFKIIKKSQERKEKKANEKWLEKSANAASQGNFSISPRPEKE